MPSELTNQTARSTGLTAPTMPMEDGPVSQIIVVTFADESQAEGLYEALKELDKKKVVKLEDAIFVTKNEEGKPTVHEKMHHEKRSGTAKGAVLGAMVGVMLGGPVLGLAGGAIVGRIIGKRMDLGIDKGTIQSVTNDLEQGHTALFIMGYAKNTTAVVNAFSQFNGKIVSATIDTDARERLEKALEENAE
jgi:uncharacterized membrane protein